MCERKRRTQEQRDTRKMQNTRQSRRQDVSTLFEARVQKSQGVDLFSETPQEVAELPIPATATTTTTNNAYD